MRLRSGNSGGPGDSIGGASAHDADQARSGPRRSLARPPPVYSRTCEPAIPPVSQRPALGCLFEVVETLVLTVLIFLGIQTFVAQPYKVQQSSMETTLLPGPVRPRRQADARAGRPTPAATSSSSTRPRRGRRRRRRAVHQAGHRPARRHGRAAGRHGLRQRHRARRAVHLRRTTACPQTTDPQAGGATEWVVPEGQLLVMGDHRQDSADSRSFGPIEISHVIGRAWLRYWPFDTFGILPTPAHPELDSTAVPSATSEPGRQPEPMSLALVAIVLAIGAGAVVAVSTREAAAAAIGLAVALVASALARAIPCPPRRSSASGSSRRCSSATLIRWAARGRAAPALTARLAVGGAARDRRRGCRAGPGGRARVASPRRGVGPGRSRDPAGPASRPVGAGSLAGDVDADDDGPDRRRRHARCSRSAPRRSSTAARGRGARSGSCSWRRPCCCSGSASPARRWTLEEIARAALLVVCAATGAALARAAAPIAPIARTRTRAIRRAPPRRAR